MNTQTYLLTCDHLWLEHINLFENIFYNFSHAKDGKYFLSKLLL